MNNEAPSLTLEEVAQLAGIEVATLRDWLNGPFGAPSDDIQQFGPFTALAVCIAAELARRNVEISKAAAAGKKFAHTDQGSPQRDYVGALYSRELGTTVLAMDIDGKVEIVPASIAEAGLGQRILRYKEIATVIFGPRGVCAINVNPFVAKIEAKIGADFGSLPRKQPHWGVGG
jgi:hypothetical protein